MLLLGDSDEAPNGEMGAADTGGVVKAAVAVEAGGDVKTSSPKRSNKSLAVLTAGFDEVLVVVEVAAGLFADEVDVAAGGADWKSSKSSIISKQVREYVF